MDKLGPEAFHQHLAQRDPQAAARLNTMDTQRNIRALEVFEATGRSLVEWHTVPPVPALDARFFVVIFDPPRPWLYERCNERFLQMIDHGAIDEVRALSHLGLPTEAPIMKALGVPELISYLEGKEPLEKAIERTQLTTRRFAKRQVTWFRRQLPCDLRVHDTAYDTAYKQVISFLKGETGETNRIHFYI